MKIYEIDDFRKYGPDHTKTEILDFKNLFKILKKYSHTSK